MYVTCYTIMWMTAWGTAVRNETTLTSRMNSLTAASHWHIVYKHWLPKNNWSVKVCSKPFVFAFQCSSSSSVALRPGVGLGLLYNTPPGLPIPCSVSPFVYPHHSFWYIILLKCHFNHSLWNRRGVHYLQEYHNIIWITSVICYISVTFKSWYGAL